MKIDAHQHFWKYNPVRDSWIDESMKVIQRDFLPKDLKPMLEANNIDACIAVQADQSEEETLFLLDLAEKNSFIKGVVGWIDLLAENVEERLAHFSTYKKLCGIRHIVQSEADDFMLRKDFQNGISKLHQFNLVYDILIFPSQLSAAIELVQKFPEQVFVLDHLAKPAIKEGEISQWKKDIEGLAQFPNVSCKVSGMVTEADLKNWTSDDFTKYLDTVFGAFGEDRILFGSDWPVCLLAGSYKEIEKIVHDYLVPLSNEVKEKIMGMNAKRIYKL